MVAASRRASRELSTVVRTAAISAAAAVIAVGAGSLVAKDGAKVVIGVVALVLVGATVYARAYGVMIGAIVLVSSNGFPLVNVNTGASTISHQQDLASILLVAGCAYAVFVSGRVRARSSLQRAVYVACSLLALWWILTWARTSIIDGVSAKLAAKYGRDFFYFALTLPLLCDVFVTFPRIRRQTLWTVGVGTFVFAVAEILRARAHVSADFILHAQIYDLTHGTVRVFSPMNSLVKAAFSLSCGALILASTRRLRVLAAIPTLIFGVAVLLALTRAAYFGVAVGVALAWFVWWFRRTPRQDAVRTRLVVVPVVAAFVLAVGAVFSAAERHVFTSISNRALSGYSDANQTSGSVEFRVNTGHEMLRLLGADWPIGLGFLHPAAHYFPTLPHGDIRNSDFGVLGALMTMGAIGTFLIYLPLLIVLRALVQASPTSRARPPNFEWIRLGTSIWIIGTIASSLTLVDLFSLGGLELTACLLAVAVSVVVVERVSAAR
jgi:hypothetical protein